MTSSEGKAALAVGARFGARLLEPPKHVAQRRLALEVLAAGLAAVDPYQAIHRHMSRSGSVLTIGSHQFDLDHVRRIIAVGAGKAGGPMAQAVEEILGDRLSGGWINVKTGHLAPTRLVHLHEAGHPIPDEDSILGTRKIVELLRELDSNDLVLGLISGGGSALLTLPRSGVQLHDLQATTSLLLRAGADINQLNTVRKHLDQIKGGGLARCASPAQIVTLILSDVIGDPLDVIASGPTVPDPTSFANVCSVIDQFDLWPALPPTVAGVLQRGRAGLEQETAKPGDPIFERVVTCIVGSNAQAAQAALGTAREQGWATIDLGSMLEGEAREVGRMLGGFARSIAAEARPFAPPACIVAGGETVVTVRGIGVGGRNQELALGAAIAIEGLPDTLIVSLGTDGTDGPTDAAGAIADGSTLERARAHRLDAHRALAQNDSYGYFATLGDLLVTGPTRTNVNDLICVFVGMPV
ncbi:MAG: glycerate kinase [Chloroflexota bacterium]